MIFIVRSKITSNSKSFYSIINSGMLSLYRTLLVPIFSEWIEIEDLAFFDSACCNSVFRLFFSELFASDDFAHNTTILHNSIGYFKWLGIRQLKIKDLSLMKFNSIVEFNKYIVPVLRNLKQIRHLEIEYGPCFEKLVKDYINNIESIDLNGSVMDDDDHINVFSKLHSLKSFTFPDLASQGNNDSFNEEIGQFLPNLECFNSLSLFNDTEMLKMRNLKKITLMMLEVDFLTRIADSCPQLEALITKNDSEIEDESDLIYLSEKCPNLIHFEANCETFTDISLVKLFAGHPNMTHLDIDNCVEITDQTLLSIANNLRCLKFCSISNCNKITNTGVIQVSKNCLLLELLDLSHCALINDFTILELSKNNKYLTSFACRSCPEITDLFMIQLVYNCKNLLNLDVMGTKVTENTLIRCVKDVDELLISENVFDSDMFTLSKTFYRESRALGTISSIELYISNLAVNPDICEMMTQLNSNLLILKLESLNTITDSILIAMVNNCVQLVSLHIDNCTKITSTSVLHAVNTRNGIYSLHLDNVLGVENDTVKSIVTSLPMLNNLKLGYCQRITDVAMTAIAESCSLTLKSLDISYCNKLTSRDLVPVLKSCQMLTALNVSYCSDMSPSLYDHIITHCSKLKKITADGKNDWTSQCMRRASNKFLCAYGKICDGLLEFSCKNTEEE